MEGCLDSLCYQQLFAFVSKLCLILFLELHLSCLPCRLRRLALKFILHALWLIGHLKTFVKAYGRKLLTIFMSNSPINVMSCYLAPSWTDLWGHCTCMRLDSSLDPTLSRGEMVWWTLATVYSLATFKVFGKPAQNKYRYTMERTPPTTETSTMQTRVRGPELFPIL